LFWFLPLFSQAVKRKNKKTRPGHPTSGRRANPCKKKLFRCRSLRNLHTVHFQPTSSYVRYLEQDEIYCRNFDRQLLQFAESLTDPEERAFFMAFAQASIDTEDAMHQLLIEQYGIDTMALPSRVTLEYNAHTQ
jgi:hypothetical protein